MCLINGICFKGTANQEGVQAGSHSLASTTIGGVSIRGSKLSMSDQHRIQGRISSWEEF